MSERNGFSVWSSTIATWVSIFGAAGGGYFALQTYDEEVAKMEDSRVVQTFALFEMFNSAERLEARQRLFDHIQSDAELQANDLYVVADFYDALQICVNRNLCDRDLSVRLFQSYAVPFWNGMEEVIVNSRTASDPHFGGGLQWMAGLPVPERDMAGGPTDDAPAAVAAEAQPAAPEAPVVEEAPASSAAADTSAVPQETATTP
jgi:hypothetical protein